MAKKDISFWGDRFEVYWYLSLIRELNSPIKNLRRGSLGKEPDFVFEFEGKTLGIETTSLMFSEESLKTNPISKILSRIKTKESKSYATKSCFLILDSSNLSFYRTLTNNFRNHIEYTLLGWIESR